MLRTKSSFVLPKHVLGFCLMNKGLALLGIVLALTPTFLNWITSKRFPVHDSGAILVTGKCVLAG